MFVSFSHLRQSCMIFEQGAITSKPQLYCACKIHFLVLCVYFPSFFSMQNVFILSMVDICIMGSRVTCEIPCVCDILKCESLIVPY